MDAVVVITVALQEQTLRIWVLNIKYHTLVFRGLGTSCFQVSIRLMFFSSPRHCKIKGTFVLCIAQRVQWPSAISGLKLYIFTIKVGREIKKGIGLGEEALGLIVGSSIQ